MKLAADLASYLLYRIRAAYPPCRSDSITSAGMQLLPAACLDAHRLVLIVILATTLDTAIYYILVLFFKHSVNKKGPRGAALTLIRIS